MIDRGAVLSALHLVRVFAVVPEESEALAALIRWADEAREAIELMIDQGGRYCPLCGRTNEHSEICPLAALLAEWPKEGDRG